jgi:hypothetical protein
MDQYLIKSTSAEDEKREDISAVTEAGVEVEFNLTTSKRPQRSVSKPIYVDLDDEDDDNIEGNKDDDDDDDEDDNDGLSPPSKKKSKTLTGTSKSTSTATPKTKAKPSKVKGGPTLEQERRRIGDAVKSRISFQMWAITASTHAVIEMSFDTFKNNIVPHSSSVVPADMSSSSTVPEVAVARVSGSEACGEAFGKSKITGGSSVQQWSVNQAEVVWRKGEPSKCDIWFTMR